MTSRRRPPPPANVRRLLSLISSDAHAHHLRAAGALARALRGLPQVEDRVGVVATLLTAHLAHPRWETRAAAAKAVELSLRQQPAVRRRFLRATANKVFAFVSRA